VESIERSSGHARRTDAARGLWMGGLDPDEIGRAVRRLNADVVHAHNLHPTFGWRALEAARRAGARTVLHLQNFRLFCAVAVAYRDRAPCYRCHGTNTLPGLRLRCRGSLTESVVYAAGLRRQQPHLVEHADRLVTVSEASADRLAEFGLARERLTVLPNFVRSDALAADSFAADGEFALAAGRLVEEKGFDTAIAAARAAGVPLVIAGAGPDERRLRDLADSTVRFVGVLPESELAELRPRAAVVLVPSRWEEPCPYSALDALADGVPVLASDRGGLPELAGPDAVVRADDVDAWTAALDALWRDPGLRLARGRAGLQRARERFGEDAFLEGLLGVYER